ncbi:MAG: 4Fe-4S dicluster domain-containing protein [Chloroflexi bacterium]|nr:4Fe-4S dicluster domain-containing protein [Chloroflexota bacterium]
MAESLTGWAMYVDLKRCIGCNACSLACKQENNVTIGNLWNRVYGVEGGTYASGNVRVMPFMCQQCVDAPCKRKCDELGYRAIIQRADGILYVDAGKCTGCKQCLPKCRFKQMFFNPDKVNKLGQKGVAEKCHFCMHRVDAGLPPACVVTCLAITREWGTYAALKAKHPNAKPMAGKVRVLYENLGPKPVKGADGPTNGYPDAVPFHG